MDIAARVMSTVVGKNPPETAPKIGMVMDVSDTSLIGGFIPSIIEKHSYPYSRPEFLYFTDDDIILSSDQSVRPVLCPKFPDRMPLYAGYAEVINAGKTIHNEDQASARFLTLTQTGSESEVAKTLESKNSATSRNEEDPLLTPGTSDSESSHFCTPRVDCALFGIFDGHAGSSTAIVASKCLQEHIKFRICEVLEPLVNLDRQESLMFGKHRPESSYSISSMDYSKPQIHSEHLVRGAIESAFIDMDDQIASDKQLWRLPGGCAAISILVLLGKLYVANAGDCRAILVGSNGTKALSTDMTPATERKRLQELAYRNPELIGNSFSRLEFSKHLTRKDLKSKVFYRDWFMDGWATKTVQEEDLRPPLISSSSRKKRLLNTIGVSRGFGDHHLLTVDERLSIKPFLSSVPEVSILNLRDMDEITDKDVVIVASDGLWDVLSNEDAGLIVRSSLGSTETSDYSRYTLAAQELVIAARGYQSENGSHQWLMNTGAHASRDDITVFIIPLKYCVVPPKTQDEEDDGMLSFS